MNLDEIKRILELVREHQLSEFEIEHEGLRLKVRKDQATGAVVASTAPIPPPAAAPLHAPAGVGAAIPAAAGPTVATTEGEPEIELAVVKSPVVGMFYRAPEPGAPDFVDIGASVKKGQVLCIIEAMKLMNEIDSEYDGEIINIYVENGQPVQYGERLFAIRTK
jgi:acetyl-CoA carboxylase biotin carboxyl carrier protein